MRSTSHDETWTDELLPRAAQAHLVTNRDIPSRPHMQGPPGQQSTLTAKCSVQTARRRGFVQQPLCGENPLRCNQVRALCQNYHWRSLGFSHPEDLALLFTLSTQNNFTLKLWIVVLISIYVTIYSRIFIKCIPCARYVSKPLGIYLWVNKGPYAGEHLRGESQQMNTKQSQNKEVNSSVRSEGVKLKLKRWKGVGSTRGEHRQGCDFILLLFFPKPLYWCVVDIQKAVCIYCINVMNLKIHKQQRNHHHSARLK